ncbi:sensor histidine kinase [Paenibacillus eucommiae]|uniref:histidine kinase n=1 Tax=Paenibacillus eucommiae TaxID=1355755 RepID=A0ABS4J225_9BACL|nr:sensor histidine kinase [Paenibacillus eucommiae]MBP1993875.1 sensor histidine kinase YesM [Paenibacillus eucommiae]
MKPFSISRFRNFWRSIRVQLVLSFMVMSIIMLILSSVLIYNGVLDILKTRSEDSTLQLFQQTENRIQAFRNEIDKVTKLLLLNPEIESYMNKEKGTTAYDAEHVIEVNELLNQLSLLVQNYDFISSIYLLTSDGYIIGLDDKAPIYMYEPDQVHWNKVTLAFQTAGHSLGDIIWLGPNESEQLQSGMSNMDNGEGVPILSVIRSFSTIYSKKWNGFMLSVKENLVEDMYGSLSKFEEDGTYIFDDNGRVVSSSNKSSIGTRVDARLLQLGGSEYGSFTEKKRQVIYYRLGETGWTLVKYVQISDLVRDIWTLRSKMMWIVIGSVFFALIISFYYIRQITKPLQRLTEAMVELEIGRIGTQLNNSNNEIGKLIRGFNRMSQSIYDLIERNKVTEKEKREIEISLLQSQLQPHFLYNTLNTIKWMAIAVQAKNIADSITFLSGLLKPIYSNPSLTWTLREEIGYLENYIKIMNIRYGEHIIIQNQLAEPLLNSSVLRFTLQPLLENTIVHGMEANKMVGEISLEGEVEQGNLVIVISDQGRGIPAAELKVIHAWLAGEEENIGWTQQFGTGLLNVHKRIQLHFGDGYGLSIQSIGGEGTRVTLVLPHKFIE